MGNLFQKRQTNFVMIGLDAAGKTTILYSQKCFANKEFKGKIIELSYEI